MFYHHYILQTLASCHICFRSNFYEKEEIDTLKVHNGTTPEFNFLYSVLRRI